jgi:hypothetical protein
MVESPFRCPVCNSRALQKEEGELVRLLVCSHDCWSERISLSPSGFNSIRIANHYWQWSSYESALSHKSRLKIMKTFIERARQSGLYNRRCSVVRDSGGCLIFLKDNDCFNWRTHGF